MQTGVLSALQLTSMFPNLVVDNFYRKTKNSIEAGKTEAPHGYVIPVQRDMTRVAELVNILRVQRIEIGQATSEIKTTDGTFPAGSYVIKRDQPYGRLAKNLLERQSFPDPNLRTYDDSGWTMGLAMLVDVKEIKDKAILDVKTTLVKEAAVKGRVAGSGSAGLAVAHFGSNNMIAFRYALRSVADEDRRQELQGRGRRVPGRVVRHRAAGRHGGGTRRGRGVRSDRGGADRAAGGGDARRRRAADRDVLVVDRHAGDRLGALHLRQVRDPLRPDLQGAGQEGQSAQRLRRHRHADAEGQPPGRVQAAGGAARCRT